MTGPFWIVLILLTATLSSARLTRLLVHDDFPPTIWLRIKWDDRTEGSDWNKLMHCHFCMSFWVTLLVSATGLVAWYSWGDEGLNLWLIPNGILAMSYVAAMIVHRDEMGE